MFERDKTMADKLMHNKRVKSFDKNIMNKKSPKLLVQQIEKKLLQNFGN